MVRRQWVGESATTATASPEGSCTTVTPWGPAHSLPHRQPSRTEPDGASPATPANNSTVHAGSATGGVGAGERGTTQRKEASNGTTTHALKRLRTGGKGRHSHVAGLGEQAAARARTRQGQTHITPHVHAHKKQHTSQRTQTKCSHFPGHMRKQRLTCTQAQTQTRTSDRGWLHRRGQCAVCPGCHPHPAVQDRHRVGQLDASSGQHKQRSQVD